MRGPGTQVDIVENLKAGLARALSETGWSERALSVVAGLALDAARNVLRGRSASLRGDRLRRIAAVLGLSEDALTGRAPWPQGALPRAPIAPAPPRARRQRSVTVQEVGFTNGQAFEQLSGAWTVPSSVFEDRNIDAAGVMLLRAPSALPGRRIKRGDLLLVDVGADARSSRRRGGVYVVRGPGGAMLKVGVGPNEIVVGGVVGCLRWL